MKSKFPTTLRWIDEQLEPGEAPESFLSAGQRLLNQIHIAIDLHGPLSSPATSEAAKLSGLSRAWKSAIIRELSKEIISQLNIDPSRERVRAMQLTLFGRSQASADLREFGKPIRWGGGRPETWPEIPDDLAVAAKACFLENENALRDKLRFLR